MNNHEFQLRPVQPSDFQAVLDLIIAFDVAVLGVPDTTEDDLRTNWQQPRFNPATDAWVATLADGRLVGYGEVWLREPHSRLDSDMYVHPALDEPEQQAVGLALFDRAQARVAGHVAAAPPGAAIKLRQGIVHGEEPFMQRLLETNGFEVVRHFWRMEIGLTAPPAPPAWPANITLRPFDLAADARAVHAAVEDAFADHWEHAYSPFEEWAAWNLERSNLDPTLWFLAQDGAEIAGAALCFPELDGGWVRLLSVRRPWRRLGLGQALLQQAFGEFYRRGRPWVGLGVDASNPTGATRLYERAGMAVSKQFDLYQKMV
ncbi:GNAT family N-acetyltransferase [Candidatus Amarolinea dominans]|uniref:GNAT family N-acetyltransferase n=1 Tax=Candidatus Amarolinea dominans TaxID=3140696 RepID=UPI001D7556A1|nr:GNAT family N-acetyltransferase [Anaerolineae bacterium]MBK7203771.1 GNAT family N-acetyltransferase [Anaerolineae bacterium]